MKKNKGSVLITMLLFVLVVLAIGGAYYFGKNSSDVLKDASDSLVKETQKQNEKVVADTEKNADIKKEDNAKNTNAVVSKCGFSINSPALNSPIYSNTPLTFSGIVDNTNSQALGCNWTMFEGEAGIAQLYYKNGNTWGPINTVKIIKVTNWMTAGPVPFTVSVNFNNSGPGFSNNTPMKVIFTENNPSGATPDTLEFPLVFKSQINNANQSSESINQDGKFIGYIKSVSNLNGNYSLKIDYIQWDSCAVANGNPESCNNGFKITNTNPLIRIIPISSNVNIGIFTKPTGDGLYGDLTNLHPISISLFQPLFKTNTIWTDSIPFWVTINNGVVTKISEQYIP